MYLILQNQEPDDFVLATGETHPVKEFVEKAFGHVGMKIRWEGKDVDEIGIDEKTGKTVVRVDPVRFPVPASN
jgi:GDPmannose 4,6-dehydratase